MKGSDRSFDREAIPKAVTLVKSVLENGRARFSADSLFTPSTVAYLPGAC
jgi:hypothetical protein